MKNKLTLFNELHEGDVFHFYDKPDRKLIKSNSKHYIAPEGRRLISLTVLVKKDEAKHEDENS